MKTTKNSKQTQTTKKTPQGRSVTKKNVDKIPPPSAKRLSAPFVKGGGEPIRQIPRRRAEDLKQDLLNSNKPKPNQQLKGTIKLHPDGYGFVLPEEAGEVDVFIPARFINGALPTDRVLVEWRSDENNRREGRVLEILERGKKTWTGVLEKMGSRFVVVNRDHGRELKILVKHDPFIEAHPGEMVTALVEHWPKNLEEPLQGHIIQVLGRPGSDEAEIGAIVVNHGIFPDFPETLKKLSRDDFSRQLSASPKKKKRWDLRNYPFLTIDGRKARDFDDAVFAEKKKDGFHLFVAIADVAHFIEKDSPLDQEALRRSTSVYFADRVIPMLPEVLSNDLCSLNPAEDRFVLVCEMIIDAQGKMQQARFDEAIIHSHHRGIYEEIQAFYDGDSEVVDLIPAPVKKNLSVLKQVSQVLLKQRKKRGSVDFDLPEAEIVYNAKGEIESIVRTSRLFTHRLIEECMIAANVAVATLFEKFKIPALYRVHEEPDSFKMSNFKTLVHNLNISLKGHDFGTPQGLSHFIQKIEEHPMEGLLHQVLLRSMKQARYDVKNLGHFGLGLGNYCHFTSPIRRYPDFIVHRQLKALISKNGKTVELYPQQKQKQTIKIEGSLFYSFKILEALGPHTSQKERAAMEAEREVLSYRQAQFMAQHRGEKFAGIIRRVNKFGIFVELHPHFVEGLFHVRDMKDDYYIFDEKKMELRGRRNKNRLRVGGEISVQVLDVDLPRRVVRLSRVEHSY